MTGDFRRRAEVRSPRSRPRRPAGSIQGPIRQELLHWLLEKFDPTSPGNLRRQRILEDLLWAQHCLFLAVRLQDDLFDGQARQASLLFASDQFLVESQRVFAEDLGAGPAFWRVYRQCLRDTTLAIVEADRLQRCRRGAGADLLEAYSRQASIFRIAPAWICLRFHRWKDYPRIARFLDAIAAADQILDDVVDMEEDRRGGRLNFAARWLTGRDGRSSRRNQKLPPGRTAGGALLNDELSGLLSVVRQQIDDATVAISPLRISPAEGFLRNYRRSLDRYEMTIHRRRVRLLFGEILAHR